MNDPRRHDKADGALIQDRGAVLLALGRRAFDQGRAVAGRALVDAARASGARPDTLDELDVRLLLEEGRVEAAIRLAGQAIDRSPQDWRLHCLRSDARLAAQDAAGAVADAAEATIAAPTEAAPKAALGTALLRLGQAGDARACLGEAVVGNPAHVGYRLAYARALEMLGETGAARATLDAAIGLRPRAHALRTAAIRLAIGVRDFAGALALAEQARSDGVHDACILGLHGHALSCLGRDEEAVGAYSAALQLAPEDSYVRHLVAAAGLVAAPSRASADYVRVLFDGFAEHFEGDLISLDYRVPGLVRAALLAHAPQLAPAAGGAGADAACETGPRSFALGPVLDLGCGTGLVALVLSDLAVGSFTGLDLSPGMLAEAAAKGLYESLVEGDICDAQVAPGPFGLAIAADVLPYFGDPAPVLAAVRSRLAESSLFILTVEALEESDPAPFRLGARARYAHRTEALCDAARLAGFGVLSCTSATLRCDRDCLVRGFVLVLQSPAASWP